MFDFTPPFPPQVGTLPEIGEQKFPFVQFAQDTTMELIWLTLEESKTRDVEGPFGSASDAEDFIDG